MKKRSIREILEELYELDASLRGRERELEPLLEQLLAAKPDTRLNKAFINRLKKELMQEMQPTAKPLIDFKSALGGALATGLIAVVLFVAVAPNLSQVPPISQDGNLSFFAPQTTRLGGKAFGVLSGDVSSLGVTQEADLSKISARNPVPGFGGGGVVKDREMSGLIYRPVEVRYTYTGEPLELTQEQGNVYRRLKGEASAAQLASQLRSVNLSVLNLGSFSNLMLNTFQLSENRDLGLQLYVDLMESSISINPNWERWGNDYNPIPVDQLPSDEELIAIANNFLSSHGVSLAAYGQPQVNKEFRYWIALEGQPAPEINEINIVYPLQQEGLETMESYGGFYGINVSINLARRQVYSVSNLIAPHWEQSAYDLVTDAERVLAVAERGGQPIYFFDQPEENQEVVEVQLDRAEQVYVRHWEYKNDKSEELFVPAIRFHVAERPENVPYIQDYIVIPLIDEILKSYETQPDGSVRPEPRPLPVEPLINADAPVASTEE